MPLLLVDLDNTLIDRDAAFRSAVADFLAGHELPSDDLSWLMGIDAGGYTARALVAEAVLHRFGSQADAEAVRLLLDSGGADRVTLADGVAEALVAARAGGWTTVIVTNGRVVQQEAKIRNTGLHRLVTGWIVSEAVGVKKPAPEIFHAAAARTGLPLTGAWVIGDSPHADIAGAVALGLPSVWVSAGKPWPKPDFQPAHIAPDVIAALARVGS